MPDLLAGTTILAQDTPVSESASDGTDINDISGTSYVAGSPEVGTTFLAPTTGRVKIQVHLLGDTDNSTNRLFLSSEVYEGASAAGTLIAAGSDSEAVIMATTTTNSLADSVWRYVEGLNPGATHYVRTVHRVSGGAVCDISHRAVMVQPLS